MHNSRFTFPTLRIEGAILPPDLLQRIADGDTSIGGLTPDAYHLAKGEKINEAINRAWNRALGAWASFRAAADKLPEGDPGTTLTRERWLLPLFAELGYGRLAMAKAIEIAGDAYPISHGWQNTPIHLVGFRVDLDKRTPGVAGAARNSPHGLVQILLNRSEAHLWGFVSNGLRLRILRDNKMLTRQAFVEFDLQAMMEGQVYADFALLWLVCHQSRVEAERPEECWLEKWSRVAAEQGTRALDQLRGGVENAIVALGRGFLAHPARANRALREKLAVGKLDAQDYYRQLLRLVYRLIFLFVAEDRGLLLVSSETSEVSKTSEVLTARDIYSRFYSTAKLRALAERRRGTRYSDLYHGLRLVMEKLATGCPELGLPALGGFLFSPQAIPDLAECEIANHDLLETIRALAFTMDRSARRVVDYKNLGSEELGSVYESLLELHPIINSDAHSFELKTASGNERKTTGSFYTPTSLINVLLDSALDPVIEETVKGVGSRESGMSNSRLPTPESQERALLSLKICDPASGSGHFLVAAAHRLARRLATIRTGDEEPSPDALRAALRDVIAHCLYGVDANPDAVELCKVSLWMESLNPGKPLSFLDAHIKCGNSLVGVGNREWGVETTPHSPLPIPLEIPDEAFNPVTGDHKPTASALKKRNKRERESGQLPLTVTVLESLDDLQRWVAERARQLSAMPEDNAAQVEQKREAYRQLTASEKYARKKLEYDLWTAAFFWKIEAVGSGEWAVVAPTHSELLRLRRGEKINPDLARGVQALAERLRFFHWELEFPEVFSGQYSVDSGQLEKTEHRTLNTGFDCVLSNPPFIGGLKISGTFGEKYRHYLTQNFAPFKGTADLCAAFYRRAFALLKNGGLFGMVATNTIGQGDTREAGLAVITRNGGTITAARRFIKWQGAANVEVNLVSIRKGAWQGEYLLDGQPVETLSSRLDAEPEAELQRLEQNEGKAFIGDFVRGIGFVLEPAEAEALLARNPRNAECLLPYLNGEDLNSHPQQQPSRYVICFHDWELERARQYPELLRIIEARVKPERKRLRGPGDKRNREYWWQFGAYRAGMRDAIAPLSRVMARSRVSELHAVAFVPKGWMYGDATVVFAFDDDYHFALLQSNVHEAWTRRNASTMRTDIRYTPSDCFDTFPFPQTPSAEAVARAAQVGAVYHEHRRQMMWARQIGLTANYNLFHNPQNMDADVVRLRELHAEMDRAILACYNWQDLNPQHDFYPNERGQTRYTVSPSARREILRRLLALNQEIAEKEQA